MRNCLLAAAVMAAGAGTLTCQQDGWTSEFNVDKKTLGVKGSSPYVNLTPGYRLTYKKGAITDTITVLAETKGIDGVETRVVEHRELKNGALFESTRDYFAIDSATGDVYYFGEDVDVYEGSKVTSHKGSWLSGEKGARFGLLMPAQPKPGMRYYQERAPGVAMDRLEIVSVTEKVTTPAGTFENCVHVLETSPLEKGLKDHKWFAAGVGQIKDGKMPLAAYGNAQ